MTRPKQSRTIHVNRPQRRWTIAAGIACAMGVSCPSLAGGGIGTANTREAAIQQATVLMPESSTITNADCTLQSGGGLAVYTCAVEWEP